ncbi:MAG TPA: carbohydrate kinase [Clostridiaceae bacterium]|nr:carbohydrate kinase [Clostridiaceae bacterium]
MSFDMIAIGETLIDFHGSADNQTIKLIGSPGGAPANVLAMASKLGLKTALISRVGHDLLGAFIIKQLSAVDIETKYIQTDPVAPTTLAMVHLDSENNRSFSFYRSETADVRLDKSALPMAALNNTKILHFGSLSLVDGEAYEATLAAIDIARTGGALISYDPNWRPSLWHEQAQGIERMKLGMSQADIAKCSAEELVLLTGCTDQRRGIDQLLELYDLDFVAVTRGKDSCLFSNRRWTLEIPIFELEVADTTGAGDAFWGAALAYYLRRGRRVQDWTKQEIVEWMEFANAAGSLTTTKRGTINALPSRAEIAALLQ